MDRMTWRAFAAAGFALLVAASASFAQQQASTVRVRGTIEAVDAPMLTVKSREGQTTYHVKLAAASSRLRSRISSRTRSSA